MICLSKPDALTALIVFSSSPFTTRMSVVLSQNFVNDALRLSIVLKKSRWSASMFSIIEIFGNRCRNVFENSHASHTITSLEPALPLPPIAFSFPPITVERSMFCARYICVSIEDVVVLPCVPDTHTALLYQLVTSPSSSQRSTVFTPLAFAAISSGLSLIIAAVYTIRSAPSIFSALCPIYTGIPILRTALSVSVSLLSEPVR